MSGGLSFLLKAAAQRLQGFVVLDLNARRHAAPLPVIDAALHPYRLGQPEQPGEGGIAPGALDDVGGLLSIHASITHHV